MGKIKVLYLDDEIENLNAFKASFRRSFDVHTALTAEEGYEILKNYPVEVVISDQRMPGTTGVDFFESISVAYPNPMRILLTGYSDINAIIDAVNRGHIYRYVSKPWQEHDLKLAIESAHNIYDLKEKNNRLNAKYRKVFTDSSDPILLFDLSGKITDYNQAATDLFDTKGEELNGVKIKSLLPLKVDMEQVFKVLGDKGVINGYECLIYGKEEVRNCLLTANVITNNYGEVVSYQAIIKDVTERSRLNKLLLMKVIETQEEERESIARDLNDGIEELLSSMSSRFKSLQVNLENEGEQLPVDQQDISKILTEAVKDLRRICFNTLPLVLQEHNLIVVIEELRTNLMREDFYIEFSYADDFPEINKSLGVSVFRVVQEFINNSRKNSGASRVRIELKFDKDSIILNLADNGPGFKINELELPNHKSLENIKTRVESFNGSLDLSTIVNQGTECDIKIPLLLN